jgi:hypothetical protein
MITSTASRGVSSPVRDTSAGAHRSPGVRHSGQVRGQIGRKCAVWRAGVFLGCVFLGILEVVRVPPGPERLGQTYPVCSASLIAFRTGSRRCSGKAAMGASMYGAGLLLACPNGAG